MPHLSPMNWVALSFILWVLMSLLMSLIWWSQTPTFSPPVLKKMTPPALPWN